MTSYGQSGGGLAPAQKRGVILTIACVAFFIAIVLMIFIQGINKPRIMSDSEMKINGFYQYEKPRVFKEFSLIDDNGDEFTSARFLGKWTLVFFGFTYCPDVCPTTLAV